MKPTFLRTVTGKTLIRLSLGGAAVLLVASLSGTWLLFEQTQAAEARKLVSEVSERARVAERVLRHTAETHEAVRHAFKHKWPTYQNTATDDRFDALLVRYPDGAWRNRKEISDGRIYPTGWVRNGSPISSDLRRRMVLFYDLSQTYGPGAAIRHDNLFFVGVPEQSNMGYDPELYPNWIFDIPDNFSQLDFEWGRLAYDPARPGAATRWATPVAYAEVPTHGPVFSAITPIHLGDRQVAAVGTTMLLNDFLGRVLPTAATESRHLIFHAGGALIADTALGERLSPKIGTATLAELGGDLGTSLQAAAKEAGTSPRSGYSSSSDVYFAVARVDGPGWFVAATLPGALLRQHALGPALWSLGAGVAVLATLLLIFASVLRRQVAAPLGDLTRAAEQLASGDTPVRLPALRDDELGRLAHAFNDMAEKVARRDAALRDDKSSIEIALTSLRLTEERWRAMTDNASDVIAVVDAKGRLSYVSPAIGKMLGITAGEVVGRGAFELVHPDDVARTQARLLNPGSGSVLFRARHADGRWRSLEAVASDLRSHPAVAGLVLNIRDVSKTVQAEEALARQRESLHQSEKLSALGGLLAGVAHELNNPLTVVVGRSIQLQREAVGPADRDTAGRIRQAAERCARIVKTFLAMARKQEAQRAPTDVNAVIGDAIDILDYTLQSGGVRIDTSLAEQLPLVMADADQLTQVFMNLLNNAHQAMAAHAGARVLTLRTRHEPVLAQVRIDVSDSGPGVPADVAARIFEPFFTTKPIGDGTGVGLSVSLGIVQAHGGTMYLDRTHVGGACFVVTLPAMKSGVHSAVAATPDAAARAGRLRVLVVDDEVEIAEILCEILEAEGHEVTVAHDGRQALECLAAGELDLVLSDLKMPVMDGPALYRRIRDQYPQLARRFIAITGDTLGVSANDFVTTSGVPVIDKPFNPGDVLRCVNAVVEAAQTQR